MSKSVQSRGFGRPSPSRLSLSSDAPGGLNLARDGPFKVRRDGSQAKKGDWFRKKTSKKRGKDGVFKVVSGRQQPGTNGEDEEKKRCLSGKTSGGWRRKEERMEEGGKFPGGEGGRGRRKVFRPLNLRSACFGGGRYTVEARLDLFFFLTKGGKTTFLGGAFMASIRILYFFLRFRRPPGGKTVLKV